MNKKFNVGNMIAIIFLIGVISSFFTSDIQIGDMINGLEIKGIEATLDTINIGLGFVAFGFLILFLIFRNSGVEIGDKLIRDWEEDRD